MPDSHEGYEGGNKNTAINNDDGAGENECKEGLPPTDNDGRGRAGPGGAKDDSPDTFNANAEKGEGLSGLKPEGTRAESPTLIPWCGDQHDRASCVARVVGYRGGTH